ncbi:unnamed protein product [Phytomonas sp. Hart1]|nr:unnamed protein product [Phytomonas sp. Hart1]|eukprot:CCW71276.1 unnamed protein product [Phytomonas sp. isolate Hart1]
MESRKRSRSANTPEDDFDASNKNANSALDSSSDSERGGEVPVSDFNPNPPSSSTSSSTGEINFGEDPTREALLPMLEEVLQRMQPGETFSHCLQRLSRSDMEEFNRLSELHTKVLHHHELLLMKLKREAILLKALEETVRTSIRLQPLWFLRWTGTPDVVNGPFPEAKMREWASKGYFEKKKAEVLSGTILRAQWKGTSEAFK